MTEPAVPTTTEYAHLIRDVSDQIKPLLSGLHPIVQSGVLANLLSYWLAGIWPPDARKLMLNDHLELVHDLVPENEMEMFGPEGHPAGRIEK